MNRAEIWTVALPTTTGREQSGQRPCLIIQDAFYGQRLPLVLIVPLTSNLGTLRFPATVQVEHTPLNGLTQTSAALVFQARAADRSLFVRRLGTLAPEDLASVLAELNNLTGQG